MSGSFAQLKGREGIHVDEGNQDSFNKNGGFVAHFAMPLAHNHGEQRQVGVASKVGVSVNENCTEKTDCE